MLPFVLRLVLPAKLSRAGQSLGGRCGGPVPPRFWREGSQTQILHQSCASASIVTIQEAHALGLHDFAAHELPDSHQAFYSGNSAASGGILVLVHNDLLNIATAE
eukprot:4290244-Amphidinium_carterae.1